jgi:hypothetical protein
MASPIEGRVGTNLAGIMFESADWLNSKADKVVTIRGLLMIGDVSLMASARDWPAGAR